MMTEDEIQEAEEYCEMLEAKVKALKSENRSLDSQLTSIKNSLPKTEDGRLILIGNRVFVDEFSVGYRLEDITGIVVGITKCQHPVNGISGLYQIQLDTEDDVYNTDCYSSLEALDKATA